MEGWPDQGGLSVLTDFLRLHCSRHEHASTVHELNESYTGTGHVVFNGAFYYHREGSRELVRYDLTQKMITGRIVLVDVEYEGDNNIYASEFNYVDLSADENGLWAVYTSARLLSHSAVFIRNWSGIFCTHFTRC